MGLSVFTVSDVIHKQNTILKQFQWVVPKVFQQHYCSTYSTIESLEISLTTRLTQNETKKYFYLCFFVAASQNGGSSRNLNKPVE